jgi:hypothetical protein
MRILELRFDAHCSIFIMRYLISNHYDYAEVPQVVHDMTGVDRYYCSSYVPAFPCSDRLFVFFLSFAAARPFALRSFAAFMSFGAVVRSCLI